MTRPFGRLSFLLLCLLCLLGFLALAAPASHAGPKPPEPMPDWVAAGTPGVDKETGEWCDQYDPDPEKAKRCGQLRGGEDPSSSSEIGEGSTDQEEQKAYSRRKLDQWTRTADKDAGNHEALAAFLDQCVNEEGRHWKECHHQGLREHPPPATTPADWAAGQISEIAADALEEAARYIGQSVVWLLEQFADAFNDFSTIDLDKTGIGPVAGISLVVSAAVATFLLLVQLGKLAISQKGDPLVTAVTGLAKWAVVLAVYGLAVRTALEWSDALSVWIINSSFDGGGSGAEDAGEAMEKQLGTLFAALAGGSAAGAAGGALVTGGGFAANAVGVVIVVGILCILAIGALWVEMLLRQAGIMILVAVMPVVLAGQLADATRDWWPKARNALIALILMKPVIVTCFAIGFAAMTQGTGIQNVIVGLIIFILACFSWPVLAKFMTFTSSGDGSAAAGGMLGSLSSTLSSLYGSERAAPAGAGAVGGSGYARALEEDNSTAAASGSNAAGGRGFWSGALLGGGAGSFGSQVAGSVGLGLQAASAGKDVLEGAAANTAAHAGLGQPAPGGGHTVIPPRRSHHGHHPEAAGPVASHGGDAPAGAPLLPGPAPAGSDPEPQSLLSAQTPPPVAPRPQQPQQPHPPEES